MNPLSLLRYPAYRCNPRQILDRCFRALGPLREVEVVRLPWGHHIQVNPREFIGRAIWAQGIHEISVCEAIARCAHAGDNVIDVGANVGLMTSLMSHCVGPNGRVIAFEPHPLVFRGLRANAELFRASGGAHIDLHEAAVGNREGRAQLSFDRAAFERNGGIARVGQKSNTPPSANEESVEVRVRTLDEVIGERRIALLKVDVEGCELEVLEGARRALHERRISAVLYEDFDFGCSGVAPFLIDLGFSIFRLEKTTWGPALRGVGLSFRQILSGADENFLAALDGSRIEGLYAAKGWKVFGL